MALLWVNAVRAADVDIEVSGVSRAMADNIRAFVSTRWLSSARLDDEGVRQDFQDAAVQDTLLALRPFGYYNPAVSPGMSRRDNGQWQLRLDVVPGEPVRVRTVRVELTGPGADLQAFNTWKKQWPLQPGERLDQSIWEAQKSRLLDLAEDLGFLAADFTTRDIALDLVEQRADLALVMDTGPRAVMGDVVFHQDTVTPEVLATIPRFERGDPYRLVSVDQLRTDLWKTGYFSEIDVAEVRLLDQVPPVVDVRVTLEARKPNSHQGSIGWGTDTEFRTQYRWLRNRLSERGDSFALGAGWQSRYEELTVFGEYRLPRRVDSQQYWLASGQYSTEVQELEVTANDGDQRFSLGSARVDTALLRGGRARMLDPGWSTEPIVEQMYVEYLYERNGFDQLLENPEPGRAVGSPADVADSGFGDAIGTLSVGIEYDWPVIRGSGFNTLGHHERGWLFTSSEAWGSDRDFTQVYLSTRRNILFGGRYKLLLRAEAGYTHADVTTVDFQVDGETFQLSETALPFQYRFKAGGSRSVRGYSYESLSDNGLGSNNIITASAELEYRVLDNWSAAAFVDIGNAFNDWSETDLKRGAGLGIRWYTIAGAVRVDVARALDGIGDDWQIHLTIGTPLL
ncbi:autotransporter assembly complex protein TamA [Marinihelvus fidelis]|uniref:autotransporter assembly complex protein TamA n=1 Tax=Marinihelvus fidelis TaxID=2613842 RepID=UPI00177BF8A1|nr:BamA/TamA family outer membrane protein [Marinihelvus fidelis]